jgi:Ca2+/Na+ antiporter
MRTCGNAANFGEGVAAFRKEVAAEVSCEEAMLLKLQEPRSNEKYGHLASFGLTSLVIVLIFLQNSVFILWLIIAILLYSYNFVIMLIPTTTERIRPEDNDIAPVIDKERKWLAFRLLMKKKKLAIEIGLTVLLGGIVPLSLSFSIIFGLAMFFAVYFGFLTHIIAGQAVILMIVQITFIILFYLLMLYLEPQAQGITKIAISYKQKFDAARSKGKKAYFIIVLSMIGLITVAGVLVIGAMLLPGFILPSFFKDMNLFPNVDLSLVLLVLVSQLVIMRHFQGIMSRWMAVNLLKSRVSDLNQEVLQKLDVLSAAPESPDRESRLKDLKKKYYSIAIYDIIRQDIFGYSPIYLVGPRLRYVLDDTVLSHF